MKGTSCWIRSRLPSLTTGVRAFILDYTWAFMSADALNPGVGFRHQISDDMESMLYVVLYCCVRWLPHNDVESFGRKVCRLFDQHYSDGDGSIVGGDSKNSQKVKKVTRFFTRNILFDNVHTQSWINKASSYLAPSGSTMLETVRTRAYNPPSFPRSMLECKSAEPRPARALVACLDKLHPRLLSEPPRFVLTNRTAYLLIIYLSLLFPLYLVE
ncbi:hypothetical protein DFH11DRAFT_165782 [Phellopilus nigrolimitatus]|nr:hypothetical protein DFH11DRAFT_165782 [Phellopilus nigrolimitatus]